MAKAGLDNRSIRPIPQGAASLQPLDLHTLLKKRPRAADPIVEITGLVVRGVGQSQQRTVSVKLNDESAPAAQLPDVKRVGDGRQTDRVAWYETALDARRTAVINADDGVASERARESRNRKGLSSDGRPPRYCCRPHPDCASRCWPRGFRRLCRTCPRAPFDGASTR